MRVLFCNIGWMKDYNGQSDSDKLVNGGKWVSENQDGGEVYNFKNLNGYYYGYVSHMHQMRIERFQGVTNKDTSIDDVLVIWVAKDNKQCNKIIGWYKNATIYRDFQQFFTTNLERQSVFYRMKADVFNSTLLPLSERIFDIPRASIAKDGVGMGQANIWYADEDKCRTFVKKVIEYIEGYEGEKENKLGNIKNLDLKSDIENSGDEFYLDKVDELMEEDRDIEAISYINKLLSKNINSVNGNNYKGIILSKLGFYDESIKYFNKTHKLNEEYSNPIFNIGKALGFKGDFENSIKYLDKYIELEKEDAEGYEYKGRALFYLRRYEEAKELFEIAYKLDPEEEFYRDLCNTVEELMSSNV